MRSISSSALTAEAATQSTNHIRPAPRVLTFDGEPSRSQTPHAPSPALALTRHACLQHFLATERVTPGALAYDRPSPKLQGFLRKHYGKQLQGRRGGRGSKGGTHSLLLCVYVCVLGGGGGCRTLLPEAVAVAGWLAPTMHPPPLARVVPAIAPVVAVLPGPHASLHDLARDLAHARACMPLPAIALQA